ncbi:SDR family oxidoreductase [Kineosporia babensis]|uniref:SDR family NAD(P)-dependent oxidoreductase n=1 Tax=Kineosporia babensis TaxID=499548 RepID=A0A9X1NNU7_9ACTN|nr:SDR family NAD(P)-dependent oxidoreductase [Kineosporia babensis]
MSIEQRDISGQVIVLTGAGSGIGAVTARELLAAGANLVVGDLHAQRLQALVQEHPDRVVAVAGDVGDPATSRQLIDAGTERWSRVDSVIANAGVGFYGGLHDYTEQQIQLMLSTNVLGTIWLARAAIEHYRQHTRAGDITIIGSVAGLGTGGGNESVYAATKAAQIQFGISLDREVRAENIRVTVLAPAGVNTHFAAATGRFGDTPPEQGQFLQPEDVAHAIVTTLRQPRRMRTSMWSMWSLAEANG